MELARLQTCRAEGLPLAYAFCSWFRHSHWPRASEFEHAESIHLNVRIACRIRDVYTRAVSRRYVS